MKRWLTPIDMASVDTKPANLMRRERRNVEYTRRGIMPREADSSNDGSCWHEARTSPKPVLASEKMLDVDVGR